MEAAQKKLNDAFDKLANDLLDTTFRGVQLRGFECSVACCKKEKDPKAMQVCQCARAAPAAERVAPGRCCGDKCAFQKSRLPSV